MKLEAAQKEFVDGLLASFEKGEIPWRAGWDRQIVKPYNEVTKKPYQGVNQMALWIQSLRHNFEDPRWMTFKQANEKGYRIQKGSVGTNIYHYAYKDMIENRYLDYKEYLELTVEERENVKLVGKVYRVFNASQISGIAPLEDKERYVEFSNTLASQFAQSLQEGMEIPIIHESGSEAFYRSSDDEVHLPLKNDFFTEQGYYAALFHELAHATGHSSRLNRDLSGGWLTDSYAKEELRAELTSAFLNIDVGIAFQEDHYKNHYAYVQSWIKGIKDEPRILFQAIKDATKMQNYMLEKGNFVELKENNLIEQRKLDEDLVETIEDIRLHGGEVDDEGVVTVYHRTDEVAAALIAQSKEMGVQDDGIFFSTSKDGLNSAEDGEAVLTFRIPVSKLLTEDIFDNEIHFRYLLKNQDTILDVSKYYVGSSLLEEEQQEIVDEMQPTADNQQRIQRSEDMSEGIFRKIIASRKNEQVEVSDAGWSPITVFEDPHSARNYRTYSQALKMELQDMMSLSRDEALAMNISDQEYNFIQAKYGVGNEARIFFDMDGVLARFNNQIPSIDVLYEQGYYANLEAQNEVVKAANKMMDVYPGQIYILSAALDSPYAESEKREWLNNQMPTMDNDHIIFTEYGQDKSNFIPGGIRSSDVLIDDYTRNLAAWVAVGAQAIKLVNDINDTNKSWQGERLQYDDHELTINMQSKIDTMLNAVKIDENLDTGEKVIIHDPKKELVRKEKPVDIQRANQSVSLDTMKNSVSIAEYARDVLGMGVIKEAHGTFRLDEHDSCKIYPNNTFYRFSQAVGGSIIDFIKHFEEQDTKGAIEKLRAYYYENAPEEVFDTKQTLTHRVLQSFDKDLEVPEKAANNKHVYAYLTKTRGIDPKIVNEYIKQKILYEDTNRNCVFTGRLGKTIHYATLRSSNPESSFKQDVAGSVKEVGIYIDNNSDTLIVNEAAIDQMSYMSLVNDPNQFNYLATCGAANAVNAVRFHMNKRTEAANLKRIIIALDNDQAGELNTEKAITYLKENYEGIEINVHLPQDCNDFNDQLKREHGLLKEVGAEQSIDSGMELTTT